MVGTIVGDATSRPVNIRLVFATNRDLAAEVAAGRFRVFAVATLDEALGVLSGLEPGIPDADGRYPEGSANALVAARLEELASKRLDYLRRAADLERAAEAPPGTEPPGQPAPPTPGPPPEPIAPPTPPPDARP